VCTTTQEFSARRTDTATSFAARRMCLRCLRRRRTRLVPLVGITLGIDRREDVIDRVNFANRPMVLPCSWARALLTLLVCMGVCDFACAQQRQLYFHKISHIEGHIGNPTIRSV